MQIIGISGSLRRSSFNTNLLRAAQGALPDDVELAIASIAEIPLYNADDEMAAGVPAVVAELKNRIADADALLISTPEYNNSMPGVLKNAIDWLSRPASDAPRVFGDLPVALMGASPGRFGTVLSQNAWLPVMRTLGAELWSGRLLVAGAGKLFDDAGNLTDADTRERLEKFVDDFVGFVRG
jgi:NAD(P)H-dependent FMN reductase